eukprot:gene7790-9139_t
MKYHYFISVILFVLLATINNVNGQSTCLCSDLRDYCGNDVNTTTCTDLEAGSVYACVTLNKIPVLKHTCDAGCQPAKDTLTNAVCIPADKECKCVSVGDRCGSNIAPACSGLSQHSVYGCDAVDSYPSLKWSCPNGCTANTPAAGNDTCFRGPVNAEGLKKVKKIVLFMQENRAFDHYFGVLPGVRGYSDPQPFIMPGDSNNGSNVFYQPDLESPDTNDKGLKYALPYPITGPKAGCTGGGSNMWPQNHVAFNNGNMDLFVSKMGLHSSAMGYLDRSTLGYYYSLIEQFMVGDMYFQSVMGPTNPNRLIQWSGSIDTRGTTPNGPVTDNTIVPAFSWLTIPEVFEKAGISWSVYEEDTDNFGDNPLEYFEQYINAPSGSALHNKGVKGPSLFGRFFADAAAGTLPQISYIVAPTQLSEHPLNGPEAGQWLTQQIVSALTASPDWENTVLLINYDESGGFYDHVRPEMAPKGTIDEWTVNTNTAEPIGPGYRTPFMMVSPFTSGGNLYTETVDTVSTLLFVEEWAIANGVPADKIRHPLISQWRRNMMADLTHALDFETKANKFTPITPEVPRPSWDGTTWDATQKCMSQDGSPPSIPYGKQSMPSQMQGYKRVIGHNPGPGRTYIFEIGGASPVGALQVVPSNNMTMTTVGKVSVAKNVHNQYFIMSQSNNTIGYDLIANDGSCLSGAAINVPCSNISDTWLFIDQYNGKGHLIKNVKTNNYLGWFVGTGLKMVDAIDKHTLWTILSVTPTPTSADEGEITTGEITTGEITTGGITTNDQFDAATSLTLNKALIFALVSLISIFLF